MEKKINEPIELKIKCCSCGREFSMTVDKHDLANYVCEGVLVQTAFPYLNADQRELIISRTCGDCFKKMFEDMEVYYE